MALKDISAWLFGGPFEQGASPAPSVSHAEAALIEARKAYADGKAPYEKIAEAERSLTEARAAQDAAELAARREREQARQAASEAASADARAAEEERRNIEIAVARRRLAELGQPPEMVTDSDDEDVLATVRALARLGQRVMEKAQRSAAIANERDQLERELHFLTEGTRPGVGPRVEAWTYSTPAAAELSTRLAAAMHAAAEAVPGLSGLSFARKWIDAFPDEAVRRRYALALGVEREPTRRELAEIEAADKRVREAEERVGRASKALLDYRNSVSESRSLWSRAHRDLEDEAVKANEAACRARDEAAELRARTEAACKAMNATF